MAAARASSGSCPSCAAHPGLKKECMPKQCYENGFCIKLSFSLGALRFLVAPLIQLTGPCYVPCLQGAFVSRLDFDLWCAAERVASIATP